MKLALDKLKYIIENVRIYVIMIYIKQNKKALSTLTNSTAIDFVSQFPVCTAIHKRNVRKNL